MRQKYMTKYVLSKVKPQSNIKISGADLNVKCVVFVVQNTTVYIL